MTTGRTEILVQRMPFRGDRFECLMVHRNGGRVAYAKALTLETVTEENQAVMPEPTFTLGPDEAQQLLDRLYDAGLRPSREVNEKSALPFVSAHLEDMRRLVFERSRPEHAEA